jgi:CBS domain-containing protein
MLTTSTSLFALTAGDLMTRDVVVLLEETLLRDAARIMIQNRISGAPVVDAQGRCVGVLSAMDFVRVANKVNTANPRSAPLPQTCGFQAKHRGPKGNEITTCTLPAGVCSIQLKQVGPDGKEMLICSEPHSVMADWQIVELEELPTDEVRYHMTADAVTAPLDTAITRLARMMIDAHIHRVVVVDEKRRPIGIVSSTDILAAVARAENDDETLT